MKEINIVITIIGAVLILVWLFNGIHPAGVGFAYPLDTMTSSNTEFAVSYNAALTLTYIMLVGIGFVLIGIKDFIGD